MLTLFHSMIFLSLSRSSFNDLAHNQQSSFKLTVLAQFFNEKIRVTLQFIDFIFSSDSDLVDIFSTIIRRHFIQRVSSSSSSVTKTPEHYYGSSSQHLIAGGGGAVTSEVLENLVCGAVRVHSHLRDMFLPASSRTHYTFTTSTLTMILK